MLSAVLNAHPHVHCVREFLNPVQERSWRTKVRSLREFYASAGRSMPAYAAAGMTMNPMKYGLDAPLIRRGVTDLDLVVVLQRDNILKQALSDLLARQRGDYRTSRTRIADPSVLSQQHVDITRLTETVSRFERDAATLAEIAGDLDSETMLLTYERLQTDRRHVFACLFGALGASTPPLDFDYTAGFVKMLSEDLRDVVANYEELTREPKLRPYLETLDARPDG